MSDKEKSKGQQTRWFLLNVAIGLGCIVAAVVLSVCVVRSSVLEDWKFFDAKKLKEGEHLAQVRGDIWQKVLGGAALLIGGVWAITHFVLKRTNEAALRIDMTTPRTFVDDKRLLLSCDVVLENIGGVRISAQPTRHKGKTRLPAYRHESNEALDSV